MKKQLSVLALTLLCGTAAAFADHSPIKPGSWKVTTSMEMPGMPFKIPPMTITMCIKEEDIKDPDKTLPKGQQNDCKMTDYKVNGNTVTWNIKCEGKTKGSGSGEITYSDDSYTGKMEMKMDGQDMTAKYSGKRLGDCKK